MQRSGGEGKQEKLNIYDNNIFPFRFVFFIICGVCIDDHGGIQTIIDGADGQIIIEDSTTNIDVDSLKRI